MIQLEIKNQRPLTKKSRRGNYSEEEKLELMSIPRGENISLHLKALSSKFNRNFANVRNQYYKILKDAERVVEATKKELSIPKRTVEQIESHNKYDSFENAWTKEETDLIMSETESSKNKTKTFRELALVLENRTWKAIQARYYYKKGKSKKTEITANSIQETIPTQPIQTSMFIKEENTVMYRAELSDSLHLMASDAVKANVRAIIDTIPDKDADDSVLHNWFNVNKDKVNYLMNVNSKELWSNN